MIEKREPTTSAGVGVIDNADAYDAGEAPIHDHEQRRAYQGYAQAIAALLSVLGLFGPVVFRRIYDPGLYLLAVSGPFVVALLFAGRRPLGVPADGPPSCVFSAIIIAVGFVSCVLTPAIFQFNDPFGERIAGVVCMVVCAVMLFEGFKERRLAFIVVGFASFSMWMPFARIVKMVAEG